MRCPCCDASADWAMVQETVDLLEAITENVPLNEEQSEYVMAALERISVSVLAGE